MPDVISEGVPFETSAPRTGTSLRHAACGARAVGFALAAGSTDEGIVAATRGTSVTHASGNKSEVPFGGLADARQAIFWTSRSRSGLVARGAVFRFGVGLISSFGRPRQDRTQRARCVRGAPALVP